MKTWTANPFGSGAHGMDVMTRLSLRSSCGGNTHAPPLHSQCQRKQYTCHQIRRLRNSVVYVTHSYLINFVALLSYFHIREQVLPINEFPSWREKVWYSFLPLKCFLLYEKYIFLFFVCMYVLLNPNIFFSIPLSPNVLESLLISPLCTDPRTHTACL